MTMSPSSPTVPGRRGALTQMYRNENAKTQVPTSSGLKGGQTISGAPRRPAPTPSSSKPSMGNERGGDNSFYSKVGSQPATTRTAPASPASSFQAPQPPSQNSPVVNQYPGGPGSASAGPPSGAAGGVPPQMPQLPPGIGHTSTFPAPQPPPPMGGAPHGAQTPMQNGPGVDPQTQYQMALSAWQAQRAQAQANGQMVNMAMFPQYDQWAQQNGYAPMPQRPAEPPMTMPSQSFPSNPQRTPPMASTLPPETVTQAPPPQQANPRQPGGPPQQQQMGSMDPVAGTIYDRPSFNYSPAQNPWAPVQSGQRRVADTDYRNGAGQGAYDRDRQQWQSRQSRPQNTIPMFAYGTGQQAYNQAGMGGQYIPSSQNTYAQGKEIPPMMQQLINQGMPIPPALLNSVTGGQNGPLNMASAFTARGGGSLPSMQGYNNMSLDEREAFGGYLTGPIGMPEASTMESVGRPTSNLQRAPVSRI